MDFNEFVQSLFTIKGWEEMKPHDVENKASNNGMVKWPLLMALVFTFCVGMLFSAPAQAQSVVKFDATKDYTSNDIQLRGKLYRPKGAGPFPAVVLMHGCGGWQPAVTYSLQNHAEYLTRHGYVVLSLDSFGPRRNSGGKVCESYKALGDARNYRSYDAFDALKYLQSQSFVSPDNIFLMGQSNGGSVAINVAKASAPKKYGKTSQGFRGVVAYYPWCGTFGGNNVDLGAPLMVFGGAKDDWVPPTGCKKVRANGSDLEVKIYPNAAHSFDLEIMQQRYGGHLVGFDQHATQDSRTQMLAFFDQHLSADLKPTVVAMRTNQ